MKKMLLIHIYKILTYNYLHDNNSDMKDYTIETMLYILFLCFTKGVETSKTEIT